MRRDRVWMVGAALLASLAAGCSCGGELSSDGDGGVAGMDGRVPGIDGEVPDGRTTDGTTPGSDAWVTLPDGRVIPPDGGPPVCSVAACESRTYLCGNCIDDDMDGLVDSQDPDCLGPCDNTENRYHLAIPGGDGATCRLDCYFDGDSGSGNDSCEWNSQCDPLNYDAPRGCPADPMGPGVRCPATQPATCHEVCGPLTPNGCDCFGCCELPADSGRYVFLGSIPAAGHMPCSPETVDDPESCRPCTPVADCLNECGRCELCLGRTELPPDCFPPPPRDGGPLPDGAMPMDSGTPPERCPAGRQACGLPGDPACPSGFFCVTGCCVFFG